MASKVASTRCVREWPHCTPVVTSRVNKIISAAGPHDHLRTVRKNTKEYQMVSAANRYKRGWQSLTTWRAGTPHLPVTDCTRAGPIHGHKTSEQRKLAERTVPNGGPVNTAAESPPGPEDLSDCHDDGPKPGIDRQ